MAIKTYKPVTNGRRNMTSLTYEEITTNKPEKSLVSSCFSYLERVIPIFYQLIFIKIID